MESTNKSECEYLLEYLGYCKKKNCFTGRDGKYCEECKKERIKQNKAVLSAITIEAVNYKESKKKSGRTKV